MSEELVHQSAVGDRLRRLSQVLEDLDMQIARLALIMGLDLDGDAERVIAMHTNSDALVPLLLHRLLGLMTLRYEIVRRCADELGAATTLHMLEAIEQHLLAQGFRPGADGVNLDRLTGLD